MTRDEPPTLAGALSRAAEALPGVTSRRESEGAGTEWLTRGVAFAAVSGGTAEFRLPALIARAALGTPDTAPSSRGRDWVSFRPPVLDRVALDRATAWLGSAHRHATAMPN